jgi:hypothetical protein
MSVPFSGLTAFDESAEGSWMEVLRGQNDELL